MKKIIKTFAFIAALMLLCVSTSMAAGADGDSSNIFAAITSKMNTTLLDLQKVVYIIGGFGLVAFSFAAVFGKISFRHLSYLSCSLFLVAAMGPFVRYFTEDDNAMRQLNYQNYCETHDCNTPPSPDNCEGDCDTPQCPPGQNCETPSGTNPTGVIPASGTNPTGTTPSGTVLEDDSQCDEWDSIMNDNNYDMQQRLQAQMQWIQNCQDTPPANNKVVNGGGDENNLNPWQQASNFFNNLNHGINTVRTVYGATTGAINTVSNVIHGVQNSGGGFNGVMNALGTIGRGINSVNGYAGNVAGAINSWTHNSGAMNTFNNISHIIHGVGNTAGATGSAGNAAANAINHANGSIGGGLNAAGTIGRGAQNIFNNVRGTANAINNAAGGNRP